MLLSVYRENVEHSKRIKYFFYILNDSMSLNIRNCKNKLLFLNTKKDFCKRNGLLYHLYADDFEIQ